MTDVLTPEQRRFNMSQIKGRDTKPEIIVRSLIHRMGFRFRLHRKDLPGKPDLVFPRMKKVIFVHGCFWHMHACKYGQVIPKTNQKFWGEKRLSNVERDRKNIKALEQEGWQIMTVWECQTRHMDELQDALRMFLIP